MVYVLANAVGACQPNVGKLMLQNQSVNIVNIHQNVAELTKGLGNVSRRGGHDFFPLLLYLKCLFPYTLNPQSTT